MHFEEISQLDLELQHERDSGGLVDGGDVC
jgi:hypothetical protein